jgi:serine/threonine protein kinase
MPYVESGVFKQYLPTLTISDVKMYMTRLLNCLTHLADHGVIHRDIKPQNFLFDPKSYSAGLIDFGLAEIDEGRRVRLPYAKKKIHEELRRT